MKYVKPHYHLYYFDYYCQTDDIVQKHWAVMCRCIPDELLFT